MGRNPTNAERNGSPARDGGRGSHSGFFGCLHGRPAACGRCHMVPGALARNQICVGAELTQLIKVRVAAVGPRNRADQASLQECRPFVHQTPLTAHVILSGKKRAEVSTLLDPASVPKRRRPLSPCRAGRCASRWTCPAPGPPPPSHGRRKTPCRHRGFRSLGPRRSRRTLVLVGTGSGWTSDVRRNGGFTRDWLLQVVCRPLSQRESCCSVRMDGRLPMLLKMVKSRPIRSVATPAYSSSPRRRIEMVRRLKFHFGIRVIKEKNYFSPSI